MRLAALLGLSRSTGRVIIWVMVMLTLFIIYENTWIKRENIRTSLSQIAEVSDFSSSGYSSSQQSWTCIDRTALKYNRAEDVFCTVLPKFLPHLKNPCFYDFVLSNKKSLRCLPYFYIIGMDKSGSTDLHSRLTQHPLVMSNQGKLGKETGYWPWRRYGILHKTKGERKLPLDDYLDMFKETGHLIETTNTTSLITGDATPMDLWDFRSWPMIPQNKGRKEPLVLTPHFVKYIHGEHSPKFIIQFREPVERLYSDYIFLHYGKDQYEFHNHSLQAIEMMNDCLRNSTRRLCYFSSELYQRLPTRIHLGCYSVFLQEWFSVFPQNAFLITRTDEYERDMTSTLTRVFQFLDLPLLSEFQMTKIINKERVRITPNKTGVILPETVEALRQFYDSCNKETAEMLNDDHFLWLNHYS